MKTSSDKADRGKTVSDVGLARRFYPVGVSCFFAALLLVPFSAVNAGDETSGSLGRLFLTPERRQVLDYQRERNQPEEIKQKEDNSLTLNGVVLRSSGKRTLWINGRPIPETAKHLRFATASRKPGSVRLAVGDDSLKTLSVGATLDRTTGLISSPLGDGTIRVRER